MMHKIITLFLLTLLSFGTAQADEYSEYTKTKYPIVLIHGFAGSSSILLNDYFFGIVKGLRESGAIVYAPSLPGINSTEERSKHLWAYLQWLKQTEGHTKFNLIGHSHGGLSARQIAGDHPEAVVSVSTMATPHNGSFPSDDELQNPKDFLSLLHILVGFTNNLLDLKFYLQDKHAYLVSTSTQGVRDFNRRYPAGVPSEACGQGPLIQNGIYQYSMSGSKVFTNFLDPSDWYLTIQAQLTSNASDGWIGRCSSHFGKVLKDDYDWNHLDEINQLFGLRSGVHNPVTVYRNHANRLKNLGL